MIKNNNWASRPLHKIVYEIVAKHKSLYLDHLIEEIKKMKIDVDEDEVRTTLIKLEIWGYIDVVTDNKGTYIAFRG